MNSFIVDLGKTNLKCQLIGSNGDLLWAESRANVANTAAPYPHIDLEGIWQWLLECLRQVADQFPVAAINISTHGACAVLLDETGTPTLPAMDYEYEELDAIADGYDQVRPSFADTLSPRLPLGLNLGRQLWWQKVHFPEQFAQTRQLLLYPQYWAWRLSGIAASERTSLGCHTDLWLPEADAPSKLLNSLQLTHTLPPPISNWQPLGPITAEVAAATGLTQDCQVFPGVHDSNASLAWHLHNAGNLIDGAQELTVVSAGTWVITMAMGTDCRRLQESRDMLANVSVLGQLVACARFMGGREFEAICAETHASADDAVAADDIQQLVDEQVFALPNFAGNSGPYNDRAAAIEGRPHNGKALATLYLALMIDLELELLSAKGPILFGSTSLKNPLLCRLLAQLRPQQPILLSGQEAGSIIGCWVLTRWQQANIGQAYQRAKATQIQNLEDYQQRWRTAVSN
ncbi:FGGY-family carbohydrate kinase [Halioxenophilus sp. WMMB6]|uniref:FGGY-family carbohydrate kinase n=1 Tax=Halioxenophilus sp. WMMB6 TaxID=3073815 RepID=UPI00295EEE0C|nr:FGGY family carbohydrate kinase [Halioxenophilus sp. WMMB6]